MRGEPFFGVPPSAALRSAVVRLGYGGTMGLLLFAPLVLFSLRKASVRAVRSARAIVVFAAFLFFGIFPSAIWSHLAFIVAPVLPILGIAGDRVDRGIAAQHQWWAWVWRTGWIATALALLIVGVRMSADIRRWHPQPTQLRGVTVSVAPHIAQDYQRAAAFIERCADPGAPIFVAPDMPMLYVVTGRPNPTPFDLTIPGNVDGPAIVEILEETRTRCVVYKPEMYAQFAPFETLFPTLVQHLETAYTRAEVLRKGPPPWYGLIRNAGQ